MEVTENLLKHNSMCIFRSKDPEARTMEEWTKELNSGLPGKWFFKNLWMGRYPEEFVEDSFGEIPLIC